MSSLNRVLTEIYRKEKNTDIQDQCERQSLTLWIFQSIGNSVPTLTPSLLIPSSISAIQCWSLCHGKHCYIYFAPFLNIARTLNFTWLITLSPPKNKVIFLG